MFAMQNEPNHRHAGPIPLDEWIRMMRIASDAVHCGVEDATKAGAGNLRGKFVGPITAGTNTNWWAAIAAAEGTDYRGEACEQELIDLFSTHSYNLPATGYEGKTPSIDRILRENHPQGRTKPILYTEIGRWMNAYLIDKEETMDSPTLFTEWAGIYARNMVEGCSGMWAFKFANTASSTIRRASSRATTTSGKAAGSPKMRSAITRRIAASAPLRPMPVRSPKWRSTASRMSPTAGTLLPITANG